MIYDNIRKIETAKRLKLLRVGKNKTDDSKRSFQKLKDEIDKEYLQEIEQCYINNLDLIKPKNADEDWEPEEFISRKSLMYYELINPEHKQFHVGKGMKVETLFGLASFYGVSCDYLLGLTDDIYGDYDNDKKVRINELSLELGLDKESVKILKLAKSDGNYENLLFTLNNLIHSIDVSDAQPWNDWQDVSEEELPNVDNHHIEAGFLQKLNNYLFQDSAAQYVNTVSKRMSKELKAIFYEFEQETFTNEEFAYLRLKVINDMLKKSRENYKPFRKNKLKSISSKIKRNLAKQKNKKEK